MKSILSKEKRCYICGLNNVEEHHIFYGNANRKISDKYGFTCYLCIEHHRGTFGVHGKEGHYLDKELKRKCEKTYIEQGHTIEDFIKLIGRSYL